MRRPEDPILFELPDGCATIITWEYIMNHSVFTDIANILRAENTDLTGINERVQDWLDEQQSN